MADNIYVESEETEKLKGSWDLTDLEKEIFFEIYKIMLKKKWTAGDFKIIFEKPHLKEFEIYNSENFTDAEFLTILDALKSFKHLKSLSLSDCRRKNLAPLFKKLQRLEHCYVANGTLADFSGVISNTNLISLGLERMCITHFPEDFFTFPKLEKLNLVENYFISLPEEIGNLPKLWEFNCSENPQLKSLPKAIGKLTNLRVLEARNCGLHTLPSSIGKCTSLYNIALDGCPIYDLPETMKNIELSSFSTDSPFLTVLPRGFRLINHYTGKIFMFKVPFRSLYGIPIEHIFSAHYNKSNLSPKGKKLRDLMTGESAQALIAYYKTHPLDLAAQFAADPSSLTEDEYERLAWEGGVQERQLLENSSEVAQNHPILKAINQRLQIMLKNDQELVL